MKDTYQAILPSRMEVGERIISEYGRIETIYRIESESIGKYLSTIVTDDLNFIILNTYFIRKKGISSNSSKLGQIKETIMEKVSEKKKNILKNIEKVTLNNIENYLGLNALASQLN